LEPSCCNARWMTRRHRPIRRMVWLHGSSQNKWNENRAHSEVRTYTKFGTHREVTETCRRHTTIMYDDASS
jgi:hypothetical protein